MNVFILNSGRCGSTTFIKACQHIKNYTAGHESRTSLVGSERLLYPHNHIEADNRLTWFLGRLDEVYGNSATYIHLTRTADETASSFLKRSDFGIMKVWREGIYMQTETENSKALADDYIDTVNTNIKLFLKDKTHKMNFHLENAKDDFKYFFDLIKAKGDINSALNEWHTHHNHS